jgi:hypothetical protein
MPERRGPAEFRTREGLVEKPEVRAGFLPM